MNLFEYQENTFQSVIKNIPKKEGHDLTGTRFIRTDYSGKQLHHQFNLKNDLQKISEKLALLIQARPCQQNHPIIIQNQYSQQRNSQIKLQNIKAYNEKRIMKIINEKKPQASKHDKEMIQSSQYKRQKEEILCHTIVIPNQYYDI